MAQKSRSSNRNILSDDHLVFDFLKVFVACQGCNCVLHRTILTPFQEVATRAIHLHWKGERKQFILVVNP